tara:strand:+ start:45 stop:1301 length:1257 start_codon:yes stop_codon:yes gene_type:complete
MPLPAIVTGALALSGKALNAYLIADFINYITGGGIGNFINKTLFGQTTGQQNKNNLGLNNRLLNLKETGTPTKDGALRFLGDGGGLDDAPDIVPTNQSVLDSIAINQGLAIGNTMVPEIDNKSSDQSGFAGIREEIDRINRNIQAIATAILTSSSIEGSYRQELLDDLEKSLVNKDKIRSRGRTERSIKNTILKQRDTVIDKTGSLAGNVAGALALSLGLELTNAFVNNFGKDEEEEEDGLTGFDKRRESRGSAYRGKSGKDSDVESVPQIISDDENTNENLGGQENQNIINMNQQSDDTNNKVDVNQKSIDESVRNTTNTFIDNSEESNVDPLFNLFNFGTSPNIDKSQNINVNPDKISFSPVESGSGTTQIIDLRTAQKITGNTDTGGSSAKLDSSIMDLVPERRVSPYEVLVRSV